MSPGTITVPFGALTASFPGAIPPADLTRVSAIGFQLRTTNGASGSVSVAVDDFEINGEVSLGSQWFDVNPGIDDSPFFQALNSDSDLTIGYAQTGTTDSFGEYDYTTSFDYALGDLPAGAESHRDLFSPIRSSTSAASFNKDVRASANMLMTVGVASETRSSFASAYNIYTVELRSMQSISGSASLRYLLELVHTRGTFIGSTPTYNGYAGAEFAILDPASYDPSSQLEDSLFYDSVFSNFAHQGGFQCALGCDRNRVGGVEFAPVLLSTNKKYWFYISAEVEITGAVTGGFPTGFGQGFITAHADPVIEIEPTSALASLSDLVIVQTTVPEPSTATALMFGLGGLVGLGRLRCVKTRVRIQIGATCSVQRC